MGRRIAVPSAARWRVDPKDLGSFGASAAPGVGAVGAEMDRVPRRRAIQPSIHDQFDLSLQDVAELLTLPGGRFAAGRLPAQVQEIALQHAAPRVRCQRLDAASIAELGIVERKPLGRGHDRRLGVAFLRKELADGEPQGGGKSLQGLERRIGVAVLDFGEKGLGALGHIGDLFQGPATQPPREANFASQLHRFPLAADMPDIRVLEPKSSKNTSIPDKPGVVPNQVRPTPRATALLFFIAEGVKLRQLSRFQTVQEKLLPCGAKQQQRGSQFLVSGHNQNRLKYLRIIAFRTTLADMPIYSTDGANFLIIQVT